MKRMDRHIKALKWNAYISDMNKVGLQEFIELQTTVYERTKAEIEKENAELAKAQ